MYLSSILEIGLKKPGCVDSNGNKITEQKGHIKEGVEVDGTKNWSSAVFLSPSIFYSADAVYAERILSEGQPYVCLVEAFVKPGAYKKLSSTVINR
jgi:hypothetical protein